MQKIKYFATFSGIGGFELGIENVAIELGIAAECVGFSEVDKFAPQSTSDTSQMPRIRMILNKINADELLGFDSLVGGFPCHDVNMIGKRAGLAEERARLFYGPQNPSFDFNLNTYTIFPKLTKSFLNQKLVV